MSAVLIVDDEATNRAMLANILEGEYKIFQAADGREALDIIRDKNNGVSLVLLDLLMPNMSGFDVLKQMKEEGISAELPIIVLTSEKSSEIESLKLGAADFLTKPYDLPEVILARVRHAIELFENSKIIRATEYDKLTGLFTPEFFFEFAERLDERSPQKAMDALVIDLARFHLLNQLNGRDFGDKVLKAMADGIRAALQKHGGIAARYGADVFYVYSSCGKDYSAFTKEIDTALSSLLKSSEKRVRVGAFLDESRALPLVERFDRALHACNSLRSKSGEELCVYDQSMAEKALFDARLLKDFESAIEQKQFKVNYQPKFDIRGEKPVLRSAEALVCWIHPELGRVRPDLFIPLFEENGLVTILDRYVWEESAKQIKKWKDEFGVTLPVSVNVSRVDMAAPDMTSFIQKIVKENGLSPADYMLEITDSAGRVQEILEGRMITIQALKEFGADTETGLARCMKKEDFYLRLVDMSLKEPRFEQLQEAMRQKNYKQAFEYCHSLKGVVGNLALDPLYKEICELTEALRPLSSGASASADGAALDSLCQKVMQTRDALLKM